MVCCVAHVTTEQQAKGQYDEQMTTSDDTVRSCCGLQNRASLEKLTKFDTQGDRADVQMRPARSFQIDGNEKLFAGRLRTLTRVHDPI